MNQPGPEGCSKEKAAEPAGGGELPAESKFGPLTTGQRARYMMNQMWKGIKSWFTCNWPTIVAGVAIVIVVLIALEILTGGAVTAALPPLMELIGTIMIGVAAVRVAAYIGEYLGKAVTGDVGGAAKALARGLAVGAIELVFALLFNLGAVIKSLKAGLKATAKAAAGAAKATVTGAIKAAKTLSKVGAEAAKATIKNGKLVLKGLKSGFAGGVKNIDDLAKRLWSKVRFRKFRIRLTRRWFVLEGFINPWVIIAQGEVKEVKKGKAKGAVFVTDDELKLLKGEMPLGKRLKPGEVGSYKDLTKRGKVNDKLTPDYIPSRAALVRAEELKRLETAAKTGKKPKLPLTKDELRAINQEGVTVSISGKTHTKASRTFGGRNKPAVINLDAADLSKAFKRDADDLLTFLKNEKELSPEFVGSYMKAYRQNVIKYGWKHDPSIDQMFIDFLKASKQ